jgi:hypothetical protein
MDLVIQRTIYILPAESVPEMGGRGIKENDGSAEFNYYTM